MSCVRSFSTKKSTLNPKQIEHFSELSKIWWNDGGVMKILNVLNDFRIPWIQKELTERNVIKSKVNKSTPFANISVLDVGCGGGFVSEAMNRMGASVVGIDPTTKLIELAQDRARSSKLQNLQYLCSTIEEHVVKNKEKYDVIVASETIDHVKEQEMFTKCCLECLQPGGSIFMTTHSPSWLTKFVFVTLFENTMKIVPRGTHDPNMFVDVEELKRVLKKENCQIISICGIMYNVFRKTWFPIKNVNLLNYALHAVKPK